MIDQSCVCQKCRQLFISESNLYRLARLPEEGYTTLTITRDIECISTNAEIGCPLCSIILTELRNGDDVGFSPIDEDATEVNLQFTAFMMAFQSEEVIESPDGAWFDFNCLRVSRQLPSESWLPITFLSISAVQGSKAAETIRQRPITKVRDSDQCFRLANNRLDRCLREHEKCVKPRLPPLPTRVVDVGDDESSMRIICGHGLSAHYAALSYCWGMPDQPVMAQRATIDDLMQGILPETLPATIRDAVTVTKRLCLRYLWVDSLCIVQDSEEDKDIQIGQIPQTFSNAVVTITAASAKSCIDGFLHEQSLVRDMYLGSPAFQDFAMPYLCPDGEIDHIIVQSLQNFIPEEQPVNKRAWTLEERLLSPRVLIFASNMVVWQCQSTEVTIENSSTRVGIRGGTELSASTVKNRLDNEFFEPPISGQQQSAHPLWSVGLQELRRDWNMILRDYTSRQVTQGRDRLRAISGLASKFAAAFPHEGYRAGLWYSDIQDRSSYFLCQLLWYCNPVEEKVADRVGDDMAPSWSWASVASPIDFITSSPPIDRDPGRVISCVAEPCSSNNVFGRTQGGQVVLQGPCRALILTLSEDGDRLDRPQDLPTRSKAYAKISRDMDPGLDFHICLDDTCDASFGQSFEVKLILLLEYAGLILKRNGPDSYIRIGAFQFASLRLFMDVFDEHLDMAAKFFGEGGMETVVLT